MAPNRTAGSVISIGILKRYRCLSPISKIIKIKHIHFIFSPFSYAIPKIEFRNNCPLKFLDQRGALDFDIRAYGLLDEVSVTVVGIT